MQGGDVFKIDLHVRGAPGPFTLTVSDEEGPDNGSRLEGDTITLTLVVGPPARLIVPSGPRLQCSTRGLLGQVAVSVADAFGNALSSGSFEVL